MLPGSPASPYSKFWGAPFLAPFARSGAFPVGLGHPFRQNYIRDYGGGALSIPRFLRNLRKVGDDAACLAPTSSLHPRHQRVTLKTLEKKIKIRTGVH